MSPFAAWKYTATRCLRRCTHIFCNLSLVVQCVTQHVYRGKAFASLWFFTHLSPGSSGFHGFVGVRWAWLRTCWHWCRMCSPRQPALVVCHSRESKLRQSPKTVVMFLQLQCCAVAPNGSATHYLRWQTFPHTYMHHRKASLHCTEVESTKTLARWLCVELHSRAHVWFDWAAALVLCWNLSEPRVAQNVFETVFAASFASLQYTWSLHFLIGRVCIKRCFRPSWNLCMMPFWGLNPRKCYF